MRLNDGVHNIGNLLSDKGALTLRHGQRIYEITVSALDYVNGSNYTYYTRLDGFSDQWTSTSSKLSFADLPPGTYRLDVRYTITSPGRQVPSIHWKYASNRHGTPHSWQSCSTCCWRWPPSP